MATILYDPNTGRKLNPGESVIDKATGKKVTQGTTTMGDYGTVGAAFSGSSAPKTNTPVTYAAPAVKTPTTLIAPAANYAAPKSDNSAALAKIAELKNQIGIASAEIELKNARAANNATINPNAAAIKTQAADIQSKINTIKEQLDVAQAAGYVGDNASKEIKYDSTGKIVSAADAYSDYSSYEKARDEYQSGLDKITSDLESAKVKQKEIYDGLATKQTQLYNTVYAELGLDAKKSKIATMDSAITTKTAERDQTVLDENGKPIAQWLITGDLKLAYDKYNNEITQLTNERNASATEYNIGLDELGKKVEAGMADAKTAASYWDNQVVNLSNQAASYQSQLLAILNGEAAAEKANTPQTEIIEANGRKLLVTYNSQGKIVSKEDLGEATKASSSTGTVNNPTSYDEWQLAGGQQGTGQSYADWLTTSKGTKPEKETDISALENTKSTISGLLANQNLKKVVNKGALSNLPYAWENLGSEEKNIIAIIDQLISQSTLDSLISAKAKGATFGALSDKESAMLRSAGSKIGSWTMENKNGKTVGYSIDEKSFRTELQTLLDLANKAITVAGGKTTPAPSNNSSNGVSSAYQASNGSSYSVPW